MSVQYLVHDKDGKGHLPYTKEDGKPDHRLMGAAWAALHGGYRGNKYEGPDKSEAIAKLKKVYEKEGMDTPSEKAVGAQGPVKRISVPILKFVESTDGLFVEGCLAAEEPDFEGEVMDYASSKPNFKSWNKYFAEKTSGESVGNLRGQHNAKIAAGKFVSMDYDDDAKKINVVAKVVDPTEQDKVREKVYTSFSIGAHYAKKWRDGKYTRWTADPFEGSLVDYGAMPSTRGISFNAAGKDTTVDVKKVPGAQKGLYTVSSFAQLIQSLVYLRDSISFEREQEEDDSPVTDRVAEATEELLECLAAYTQEQVSEEIGRKSQSKEKAAMPVYLEELIGEDTRSIVQKTEKAAQSASPDDLSKALASLKTIQSTIEAAHKAKSGAAKCNMSAEDCKDDNCSDHKEAKAKAKKEKEEKSAAAGSDFVSIGKTADGVEIFKRAAVAPSGSGDALKRADIEQLIDAKMKPFEDSQKAIGDSLETIAKAITSVLSQPAPTQVKARPGLAVVTKETDQGGKGAEKSVSELAEEGRKSGSMVSAIVAARQKPNYASAD